MPHHYTVLANCQLDARVVTDHIHYGVCVPLGTKP